MKTVLVSLPILSLALNAFLWSRLSQQRELTEVAEIRATESEHARQQAEALGPRRSSPTPAPGAEVRELAQLRNEVSQLRKQVGEASQWHAQAIDAGNLRQQLTVATQELARAEAEIINLTKLSPNELQQLKDEAHSVRCVNHMKQIALGARIWANDNNGVFPPDLVTMKNELSTPRILFCPGETGVTPASEWSALNPSSITYRYLNAGSSDHEPDKLLLTCPFHGHTALSDGSVHRR